ncbi:MAG: galactofuranose ABC transporter, permease protein YjfF [Planctomycetota bacterium]|nr:galactofuranose ABC transporter, permease protein YjfF [Planctomycetota bacterium]
MRLPLGSRDIPLCATAIVLLGIYLFGAVAYPNFASWAVLRNLLVDNAFLGVAAIGATLVILSGGIDLSVGSVMAFTSILIAALIEEHGVHPIPAMLIALTAGLLFGTAQGWLIRAFRLPPFLITLAGLFFARGAAFIVHPQSIGISHPFVSETLNETLSLHIPLGPRGIVIPLTVFILIASFAAAWFVLRQMRFGRAIYAIGDDEQAAMLMGLPVGRTTVLVYSAAGLLSALAGVVFTLYQQSGDPAACKGLELDAIAAVIIGGTLLQGGVGSIIGTFLGVLILGLIQTLITFQGDLSSWWTRIAVGGLVLAFLILHRVIESIAGGSLRRLRERADADGTC